MIIQLCSARVNMQASTNKTYTVHVCVVYVHVHIHVYMYNRLVIIVFVLVSQHYIISNILFSISSLLLFIFSSSNVTPDI